MVPRRRGGWGRRERRPRLERPYLGGMTPEQAERRKEKVQVAARLRANPTQAEGTLYLYLESLRPLGFGFSLQSVQLDFIVDLWCAGARLAIELDGWTHEDRKEYDAYRDATLLEKATIVTMRFANERIFADPHGVVAEVYEECLRRTGAKREEYDPEPADLQYRRWKWTKRQQENRRPRAEADAERTEAGRNEWQAYLDEKAARRREADAGQGDSQ